MLCCFPFRAILAAAFVAVTAVSTFAQQPAASPTPPEPDDETTERVLTEEIKLSIQARNSYGRFDPTLIKDDLLIVEDRVPHTPNSLRRVPASVLIVLDMGGENRFVKNTTVRRDNDPNARAFNSTQATAIKLIENLQDGDLVALMQYHDRVEILSEWTENKAAALETINKKTNFGKRSQFVAALNAAVAQFEKQTGENRHLVLITDGVDSTKTKEERAAALRKLVAANVNVHVLSYTAMERAQVAQRVKTTGGGDGQPIRSVPADMSDPINRSPGFKIFSINTDRAWIKEMKRRGEALQNSETELVELVKDTGGEIYLPDNVNDLIERATRTAGTIDSHYVVTYTPKRPLADASINETREIGVVARRVGLEVSARRKIVVPTKKQ